LILDAWTSINDLTHYSFFHLAMNELVDGQGNDAVGQFGPSLPPRSDETLPAADKIDMRA
jgi:hypothetical protein